MNSMGIIISGNKVRFIMGNQEHQSMKFERKISGKRTVGMRITHNGYEFRIGKKSMEVFLPILSSGYDFFPAVTLYEKNQSVQLLLTKQ